MIAALWGCSRLGVWIRLAGNSATICPDRPVCVQGYLGQSSKEYRTRTAPFCCLFVCFVFSPRKDPDVSNCAEVFVFYFSPKTDRK